MSWSKVHGPRGFTLEPKAAPPVPDSVIIEKLGAWSVEETAAGYFVRKDKRLNVIPCSSKEAALKLLSTKHPHGNTVWAKWNRTAKTEAREAREARERQREERRVQLAHEEAALAGPVAAVKAGRSMTSG